MWSHSVSVILQLDFYFIWILSSLHVDLSHALRVLFIQSPSSKPLQFSASRLAAMNTHLQHAVPSLENSPKVGLVHHIL